MKILFVVLLFLITKTQPTDDNTDIHKQELSTDDQNNDMRKFDNLLARFDKDANGKLSIQEFMAWMQELTEEQGGFYEQDYYDVIKTILTEFLDENGELNREGATKMQESIEAGKYDELFARHFEKYSLNPTETMADEAL